MKRYALKSQIVEIASRLIEFKTLTSNEVEIRKLFDYVKSLFLGSSYKVYIEEFDSNPILIIEPLEDKKRPYICCHIDVVVGITEQFFPKVESNKLYGRGAYDMKTQAALSIALLLNNNLDTGLILCSDEEFSKNENGANFIAKKIRNKASLVIVPDGESDLAITIRGRGMGEYKIISEGKAARYSYPWKGINPYENLFRFYLNLSEIFPEAKKASDNNFWYTTYNLISVDAKDGSQVPDVGDMNILINCTTEFNRNGLLKALQKYGKQFECKVKEIFFGAPYEVSTSDPTIVKFKDFLDKNAGYSTEFLTMGAITDVRHFSEQGIPTILCRISGDGAHSPVEYSDLNSAIVLYKTLEEFLKNYVT